MAFPADVLTEDERVVMHLHPHWKAMVRPILVLLVAVTAVVIALVGLPQGGVGDALRSLIAAIAVVAVLPFSVRPLLVRQTTHYVLTNERVLVQRGVLSRDRRDIPLARVNDHALSQHFLERLFGCGTLTIESAGERGQCILADVPHVERVQTALYELVEADHHEQAADAGARSARPPVRHAGS